MAFKTLDRILVSAALLFFVYSCGGSGDGSNSGLSRTEEVGNTGPEIDINAPSQNKGIGKFTSVSLEPLNQEMADKGKAVFSIQCATCHTLGSDRLIGPGLKGITEKRSPEWILNIITNPEENLKKDPLGKALLEEYKAVMPYQGITEEGARQILEFLRSNDAG